MKTHQQKSIAGFSLVEVLIALVVISGSMISLAKFQSDIFKNNTIAKQRTEATIIAQRKIEEYRQLATKGTADATDAIAALIRETTIAGSTTSYTVQVSDATALAKGDVQLNLSVTWDDLNSSTDNTLALTSVVSAQQYSESSVGLKGNIIATTTSPTTAVVPKNSCKRLKKRRA